MYGIIRLCTTSNSALSWVDSRGLRRCASQTDWKATLYDVGSNIDVVAGSEVNISGVVLSEGSSGVNEVRIP
jgi:hypothetical protein